MYHIYTVCVPDEELYGKLSKFPKFSLSENDSGMCDVVITKENETFYAESKTDKGRTALKDIKGAEEEINTYL